MSESQICPFADMTPAVRNALTRAKTRLSAIRSRTRLITAECPSSSKHAAIGLEDPVIVPGPEGMNLSDRILGPTFGAEP